MLKWTSVQKPLEESSVSEKVCRRSSLKQSTSFRIRRRCSNVNKENIITSTPVNKLPRKDFRSAQLNLVPTLVIDARLQDPKTPLQYASTLPKYEEEYSPSTLVPGQVLAMRGILPDAYVDNPRYIPPKHSTEDTKPFAKIQKKGIFDQSEGHGNLNSAKMSDANLDKLIDAILDSAKKYKKYRSRRNSNLRRKALLKNSSSSQEVLSPSYTPGDDPASDLSFSTKDEVNVISEMKVEQNSAENNSKITNETNHSSYFEVGLELPSVYV